MHDGTGSYTILMLLPSSEVFSSRMCAVCTSPIEEASWRVAGLRSTVRAI